MAAPPIRYQDARSFGPLPALGERIRADLRDLYRDLSRSGAELEPVWRHYQSHSADVPATFGPGPDEPPGRRLAELEAYLLSPEGDAAAPLPALDESYPMASYFVSSSHNTYLSGNQLSSVSSADEYRKALERGCRCVEIDVWNGESDSESEPEPEPELSSGEGSGNPFRKIFKKGKDKLKGEKSSQKPVAAAAASAASATASATAEPSVYHGYTLTKAVSFREVCHTIRQYAFKRTPLPLILSLEVHTDHVQQQKMVDIMEEAFAGLLVEQPDEHEESTPLPALAQLHNKILIKVKYTAPQKAKSKCLATEKLVKSGKTPKQGVAPGSASADRLDDSDSDDYDTATTAEAAPEKPAKIIEALGRLGYYTRSYHFKSFSQPEASIPTHIFSLSEGAVVDMHKDDPLGLWNHNRDFMMRTYPAGTRITSSNFDPILYWRRGIQVIALNLQNQDKGNMINQGMFADTPGWVLKPEYFRGSSANTITSTATTATTAPPKAGPHTRYLLPDQHLHNLDELKITFYSAQDLPLPAGESPTRFDPYLSCRLHVEHEPTEPADPSSGGRSRDPTVVNTKAGARKAKVRALKRTSAEKKELERLAETAGSAAAAAAAAAGSASFGGETVAWEQVHRIVPELSFVRFKLMDADLISSDDLAGWACVRLDRLRNGFRLLRLYDERGEPTRGTILIRVEKRISRVE